MVLLLVGLGFGLMVSPASGESISSPFGVNATRELPTYRLQQTRRDMLADRNVSYGRLRALADAGDGLAAWAIGQKLEAMNRPDLASDVAHYYATAVISGRLFATPRLVDALDAGLEADAFTNQPTRLRSIGNALEFAATNGEAVAAARLARAWQEGDVFGTADAEKSERYARMAAAAGQNDAIELIVRQKIAARDVEGTKEAINLAGSVNDLGMVALGQNLLRQMQSDQEEESE
ncbi:hypothetical protein AYJ57_24960 (plasmid) [Salipiger sp. CCB-MM3]|nr:hypothetical protein AYJ57_24960 [Salipiger sp. CCB-MM3]